MGYADGSVSHARRRSVEGGLEAPVEVVLVGDDAGGPAVAGGFEFLLGFVVGAAGGCGVAAEAGEGVAVLESGGDVGVGRVIGRAEEFGFDGVGALDRPLGLSEFADEKPLAGRGGLVFVGVFKRAARLAEALQSLWETR